MGQQHAPHEEDLYPPNHMQISGSVRRADRRYRIRPRRRFPWPALFLIAAGLYALFRLFAGM